MSLQIDTREASGVTVLELEGHLVMGIATQALLDRVHQLLAEKKTRILLCLGSVSYIDSAGVGELVACLTTAKKNDVDLKFASPSGFVTDVLRAVHLIDILKPYNSKEEALASFAG